MLFELSWQDRGQSLHLNQRKLTLSIVAVLVRLTFWKTKRQITSESVIVVHSKKTHVYIEIVTKFQEE